MNQLVNSLQTSKFVKETMNKIDRYNFCVNKQESYIDKASSLFSGQTISAPHMHAKALEYLEPVLKPGSHILDIGSGSGYLTACFGEAVKVYHKDIYSRGKVIGIDVVPELINYSNNVINNYHNYLHDYKRNFKILLKDGKLGYPSKINKEIYDGIHIGAASDTIPYYVLQQLKKGGILVLPLKIGDNHVFTIVTKDLNGNISIELKGSVRYVPLV